MASWRIWIAVAATLGLIAANGVADVQSAGADCTGTIANLEPCLPYASGDVTNPDQACCSALATEVKTDLPCLCQLFTSGRVNQTQAVALLQACHVSTPPVSQCSAGTNSGTAFAPSMILSVLTVGVALTKVLL